MAVNGVFGTAQYTVITFSCTRGIPAPENIFTKKFFSKSASFTVVHLAALLKPFSVIFAFCFELVSHGLSEGLHKRNTVTKTVPNISIVHIKTPTHLNGSLLVPFLGKLANILFIHALSSSFRQALIQNTDLIYILRPAKK